MHTHTHTHDYWRVANNQTIDGTEIKFQTRGGNDRGPIDWEPGDNSPIIFITGLSLTAFFFQFGPRLQN